METDQTKRALRSLDGATAVFRDAKGRLQAADVRIFSIIAAARSSLARRLHTSESPGGGTGTVPFILEGSPFNFRPDSKS